MENVNGFGAYLRSVVRAAGFTDLHPRIRSILQDEDTEETEEQIGLDEGRGRPTSAQGRDQ